MKENKKMELTTEQQEMKEIYTFLAAYDTARQNWETDSWATDELLSNDEEERLEYIEEITFAWAEYIDMERDENGCIIDEEHLLNIHAFVSIFINQVYKK